MQQPRAMKALAVVLLLSGSAAAQQVPSSGETAAPEDPIRRELEELRARQRWLEQRLTAAESRGNGNGKSKTAEPTPPLATPGMAAPPIPSESTVPRFHF